MKKIILSLVSILLFAAGVFLYFKFSPSNSISFTSPIGEKIKPLPLKKYAFENLSSLEPEKSQITIKDDVFSFQSEGKIITGQINIPETSPPKKGYPVILMLRGYIDPQGYKTGDGTRNAATYFSSRGFITLAPDFLGFGGSDDPDVNSVVARLKRPYNLLTLLNSLDQLPSANHDQLFIWAHSNGGQIALSLLEITGKNIPTTLWAPVSKPFPYSILYYTDEYDDHGKAIRKVISDFESNYDVNNYSIHKYLHQIKAPILIHQGTLDDAVPMQWSSDLNKKLQELEIDVKFYTYPGTDHNLRPSWDTVIKRDLNFFTKYL